MLRALAVASIVVAGCGPSVIPSGEGNDEAATTGTTEMDDGSGATPPTPGTGSTGPGIPTPVAPCDLADWRVDRNSYCCPSFLQPCGTVNHECDGAPHCETDPSFAGPVVGSEDALCELTSMAAGERAVHTRATKGRDQTLLTEVTYVLFPDRVVRVRWEDWTSSGGDSFTNAATELCRLAEPDFLTACLATTDQAALADCLNHALVDCNPDPQQPVFCDP